MCSMIEEREDERSANRYVGSLFGSLVAEFKAGEPGATDRHDVVLYFQD